MLTCDAEAQRLEHTKQCQKHSFSAACLDTNDIYDGNAMLQWVMLFSNVM